MGEKKQFPEWAKMLYRGVRAGIAAAIAQTLIMNVDWSNLEESWKNIAVVLVTGFLPPVGMALRDIFDKWFGYDEKSAVQKLMPV